MSTALTFGVIESITFSVHVYKKENRRTLYYNVNVRKSTWENVLVTFTGALMLRKSMKKRVLILGEI